MNPHMERMASAFDAIFGAPAATTPTDTADPPDAAPVAPSPEA